MTKKDIIKTLDIASFIAVIVATILVFVFQFTGEYLVMKYSIIMYDVTFLTLVVVLSFKVYEVFSKKEIVDAEKKEAETENVENAENVETEEHKEEQSAEAENNTKQAKTKAIVWLVLASVAFVFTTVLMVLY